jgi:hypothetical protein
MTTKLKDKALFVEQIVLYTNMITSLKTLSNANNGKVVNP